MNVVGRDVAAILNQAAQGAGVLLAKYQVNKALDSSELERVKRLLDEAWTAYAKEQGKP